MRHSRMTIFLVVGFVLGLAGIVTAGSVPYLGQEPPGFTPELFAPGFFSSDLNQHSITFTPDGNECYYTEFTNNWGRYYIMKSVYRDGAWTPPERASFSTDESLSPCISSDGSRLFFCTRRSVPEGTPRPGRAVWECTRTSDGGWSEPVEMVPQISSTANEASCHLSDLGNMFVCSWRSGGMGGCDGWRIPYVNGQFQQAENLRTLNTFSGDCHFVTGPNESYIIFQSSRPSSSGSGFNGSDLYISFALPEGGWAPPLNLGPKINCPENDIGAWISHDGRYLFFSSTRQGGLHQIHWVQTKAFLPDPNGPIQNINSGRRYSSIGVAINYAQAGDMIVIEPGIYTENLVVDKDIVLESVDPNDPAVVAATVIQGINQSPVVTIEGSGNPYTGYVLDGFTITGGTFGVSCCDVSPTIKNCTVGSDGTVAIDYWGNFEPTIIDCNILGQINQLVDPRLAAHWKLDEAEGDMAYDSVGENHGALNGNPLWQPDGGMVNGAIELDGINDYISTPFIHNPYHGKFSVFAWVKGGAPGQVIISQEEGVNWLLADAEAGALRTYISNPIKKTRFGSEGGLPLISSAVITDGNWHRVGFIRDGTDRILYVDEIEVARDTVELLDRNNGSLYIGADSNLEADSFWTGMIDDVRIRIFDRAITP